MTIEIFAQIAQLGATGLLALVLYFGLQANARMLDILAQALKDCMEEKEQLGSRLAKLERSLGVKKPD